MNRIPLQPLFLLAALVLAAPADAMLVPLAESDGRWYPTECESVEVVALRLVIRETLDEALTGDPPRWIADAEVRLRNFSGSEWGGAVCAGVDGAGVTVWENGALLVPELVESGFDPAHEDRRLGRCSLVRLTIPAGGVADVRVAMAIAPTVDPAGQVFVEVPTQLLAAWAGPVRFTGIELRPRSRVLGFQTSLSGSVQYDEPDPIVTWHLVDWEPRLALESAWVSPWSALLAATVVERCPAPWDLVAQITSGDPEAPRAFLSTFDRDALLFCSLLPLALHGGPLGSEGARSTFAGIDMSRYLPGPELRGPLYRENPAFDASFLSDAESMYRNTLVQALEP